MHFYPHNIPDFNNATRHLTRVQRSVYRDAIERYYDKEDALDGSDFNKLCRVLLCVSDEEITALRIILDEFFVLVDGRYRHDRCDLEIEKYRSNSTAKARAGKASAEARKNKCRAPVEHMLKSVEQNSNQEPITNNQEPILKEVIAQQVAEQDKPAKKTKPVKPDLDYSSWPQQPDQQILNDWIAMRKHKKGSFSQTVIDGFGKEFVIALRAGYSVNACLEAAIMSNWTGFKFSWLQNQNSRGLQNGNAGQPKSPIERFMQQHYPNAGTGFENDQRPMGGDDGFIRGAMDAELRGDAGQVRPMASDLIGDFSRTDS